MWLENSVDIDQIEKTARVYKKVYIINSAAMFIIARTWKQPRCPSADEWIWKL